MKPQLAEPLLLTDFYQMISAAMRETADQTFWKAPEAPAKDAQGAAASVWPEVQSQNTQTSAADNSPPAAYDQYVQANNQFSAELAEQAQHSGFGSAEAEQRATHDSIYEGLADYRQSDYVLSPTGISSWFDTSLGVLSRFATHSETALTAATAAVSGLLVSEEDSLFSEQESADENLTALGDDALAEQTNGSELTGTNDPSDQILTELVMGSNLMGRSTTQAALSLPEAPVMDQALGDTLQGLGLSAEPSADALSSQIAALQTTAAPANPSDPVSFTAADTAQLLNLSGLELNLAEPNMGVLGA